VSGQNNRVIFAKNEPLRNVLLRDEFFDASSRIYRSTGVCSKAFPEIAS
jgi:hypothetical protein